MDELIKLMAVYAIPVIFAITLHEGAHAYAARYFGDNTAYVLGRMSLNPFKHIDPIGTLLIPVGLYLLTGGAFVFGYAKPVPINFSKLNKPKRDMAWVALAGPAANFVMALGWILVSILLQKAHVEEVFFLEVARAGITANLVMFALNLFPMLPLDGGRILVSILPMKQSIQFSKIEPYGFVIVLVLMYLNIFTYWLNLVMMLTQALLQLILSPLQFLLN